MTQVARRGPALCGLEVQRPTDELGGTGPHVANTVWLSRHLPSLAREARLLTSSELFLLSLCLPG